MIFITTYKIKPFLSKDETRKLLEVFAKEGAGPGTTAHYVARRQPRLGDRGN
jgi:hypothetical protein